MMVPHTTERATYKALEQRRRGPASLIHRQRYAIGYRQTVVRRGARLALGSGVVGAMAATRNDHEDSPSRHDAAEENDSLGCGLCGAMSRLLGSVVIPSLKKIDAICAHRVDEPMFFGDPTGPCPRQNVLQRFRFPDALEGIPHDRFDQIKNPKRHASVRLYPVSKVLTKLGMKDRETLRLL
jgi:hypothetical protein